MVLRDLETSLRKRSDDWMKTQFEDYKVKHPEKFKEPEEEQKPKTSTQPNQPEQPKEEPKETPTSQTNQENSRPKEEQKSETPKQSKPPKRTSQPNRPRTEKPKKPKPKKTRRPQSESVPSDNEHASMTEEPKLVSDFFDKFQNLFQSGGVCFIRPKVSGLKKNEPLDETENSVAFAFMHVFNPVFSNNDIIETKKTRKALESTRSKLIDHDKKFRPKYAALAEKIKEATDKGKLSSPESSQCKKFQNESKKLFSNARNNLDKIMKKLHSDLSLEGKYNPLKDIAKEQLYRDLRISNELTAMDSQEISSDSITDEEFKKFIDRFFKIFGIRDTKDTKDRYYRIGIISYKPRENYKKNRRLDYVFTEIFDKCFDEKNCDSQTRRWCQRFQKELGKYSSNYFTKFINLEKEITKNLDVLDDTTSGAGKKIVDLFTKARKYLFKIFEGMYRNSKNLLYRKSLVYKNKEYFKAKLDTFKKLKKETDASQDDLISELKQNRTKVFKAAKK